MTSGQFDPKLISLSWNRKRKPAYTDRILYRTIIDQPETFFSTSGYRSFPALTISDHKPVRMIATVTNPETALKRKADEIDNSLSLSVSWNTRSRMARLKRREVDEKTRERQNWEIVFQPIEAFRKTKAVKFRVINRESEESISEKQIDGFLSREDSIKVFQKGWNGFDESKSTAHPEFHFSTESDAFHTAKFDDSIANLDEGEHLLMYFLSNGTLLGESDLFEMKRNLRSSSRPH